MSRPVLSGDLRAIPLADVLLLLNNNRKTGSLRCAQPDVTKTVEWEGGEIIFARSSRPEDRLGAFLLSRGKVTPAQLEQASREVGARERLGKTLVRLGAMKPDELWDAVRGQVIEIVYSLFHWKEGFFDFREGPPTTEKIALQTSMMNVIMEGTRRLDEWSRVKQRIQSDRVILAPVKSLEEVARSVKLSEFEKSVMGLVDGRRTVRDIVALAGRSEFDSWQALYALLSAGVVRVQLLAFDTPSAGPAAPAPSQDDSALDEVIDRYGEAIATLLGRAVSAGGPVEAARLRRLMREASFLQADLLKEIAVEPDGRLDRRILLANAAEYPAEERARVVESALGRLIQLLVREMKGTVRHDDVLQRLGPGAPPARTPAS